MSRSVYHRSQLTAAQINTVQRQQFEPATDEHQIWYRGQQQTLHYLFKAEAEAKSYHTVNYLLSPKDRTKYVKNKSPLDELVIDKNGFKLTNRELAAIVNAKKEEYMRSTCLPGMSDEYVKMICEYVNAVRNQEMAMKGPSCVRLTSEKYDGLLKLGGDTLEVHCIRALKDLGYDSMHAFMGLDFLFIPHVYHGHTTLLGLAPKQHFVFMIDSTPQRHTSTGHLAKGLTALLLTLIPDFSYVKYGTQAKPEDWNLFGQWSFRSQTTDGSPDSAQQHELYNCGIFATTTAFCLAFGFDLNCLVEADLNKFKKPRMVAEFVNGGFSGPDFDYDLLNIPEWRAPKQATSRSSKQTPPTSSQQAQAAKTQQPATSPKTSRQRSATTVTPKRGLSTRIKTLLRTRKRKQSEANKEQRGFGEDKEEEEGSDGESDNEEDLGFKKEPLYTRRQLAYTLNLLPENSSEKPNNALPFPPQFNSKSHKQATLICGGVPELFNIQDRKYSKRELKQACRDFRVEGWQSWSFERQGFFMKYVMNEISGMMARRRGDDVQPLEGIGEVAVLKVETAPIRVQAERASKRRKTAEVVQKYGNRT